jgi:hypothetical protein
MSDMQNFLDQFKKVFSVIVEAALYGEVKMLPWVTSIQRAVLCLLFLLIIINFRVSTVYKISDIPWLS